VSSTVGLELTASKNRTSQYELSLLDAEGDEFVFESSNVLRVLIGKGGATPDLDINSNTTTTLGSYITLANPAVLVIMKDDLAIAPGVYDLEVLVLDDATGENTSLIKKGIFVLRNTMGGTAAI